MEDSEIVALYWARSELAVARTQERYGPYCRSIAWHILMSAEDADECVNDTWLAAWNTMPPHRPAVLRTFLGKLTRRLALHHWRDAGRLKRGGGETALALSELEESVPSGADVEAAAGQAELAASLDRFLAALPELQRCVFLRRYWYLDSVAEISRAFGFSESKVKSMLHRTRLRLREYLEEEGLL